MATERPSRAHLSRVADGYLLVEAIIGVVLLGVGALGIAAALGQAEQLAAVAVQRDREAVIRAELAAALAFGLPGTSGWQAAGQCWRRSSAAAGDSWWIEARCGVGVGDLPANLREPGLLVPR